MKNNTTTIFNNERKDTIFWSVIISLICSVSVAAILCVVTLDKSMDITELSFEYVETMATTQAAEANIREIQSTLAAFTSEASQPPPSPQPLPTRQPVVTVEPDRVLLWTDLDILADDPDYLSPAGAPCVLFVSAELVGTKVYSFTWADAALPGCYLVPELDLMVGTTTYEMIRCQSADDRAGIILLWQMRGTNCLGEPPAASEE